MTTSFVAVFSTASLALAEDEITPPTKGAVSTQIANPDEPQAEGLKPPPDDVAEDSADHPPVPKGKKDKNWSPESSYTIANTGLKGTQERVGRPNPLFSPTVAQINLTKGSWSNWPWESSGITGDWFGLREHLQDNGIFIEGGYNAFLNYNFSGGLETGGFSGGILNTAITVDTETLMGHPDGLFFFNFQHWDWYSSYYEIAGGFNPIPNYTGVNGNLPDNAALNQISQLYYSQHLFDHVVNIAFGKQDGANIFSNIPGAGGFMYDAAGYSATLNPYIPSWPYEATALTAIVNFNEDICASFGWFDGSLGGLNVTRDLFGNLIYSPPPNPGGRGPSTFFDNQGHWFLISEWGVNWQIGELDLPGVLCAGGWLQTGRSQTGGTLNDGPGVENIPGTYVSLSQTLWAPSEQFAKQGGGIIAFGQFGWSDPNKNAVHWSLMGGISATGVIPGRPMDAMGILGAYTGFSDNPGTWQSTTPSGGIGPTGGGETAFEAFYRLQITPWCAVQPGIEWLGTPSGGDPSQIEDAVVGYLMVEIIF
ncbi:MAG: carbohydrate porin [Planctomycetota bacterium]|nr:carbohydrate porin [Planctomycetota bacterium]